VRRFDFVYNYLLLTSVSFIDRYGIIKRTFYKLVDKFFELFPFIEDSADLLDGSVD
jgi:hypothetical protein